MLDSVSRNQADVVRHRRHDRRRGGLGVRQIGDGAAVAQDEDPISAFDNLLELR